MHTHPKRRDAAAGAAAGLLASPTVVPTPVSCPIVTDRTGLLAEAVRQAQEPFAAPGSRGANAQIIQRATARPRGLRAETALRQVTESLPVDQCTRGANPLGTAAEIVATHDYVNFEAGLEHRLYNPPSNPSPSVVDVRVAPDAASKRDLWFIVKTKKGMLLARRGGQVKVGSSEYVTRKLVKMAKSPGYGKLGVVDARLVNPDGTPRIGPEAFTKGQARRLQEAGVRLRGVEDLEARAGRLLEDIPAYLDDGLTPQQRADLHRLRNDIAKAYRGKALAGRVAGGAAVGFATGALLSLILQKVSGQTVDVAAVAEAGGQAALFGGGAAAADAGLYHAATRLGLAPEAAKTVAQRGVAGGLCLLAIGADVFAEAQAVRSGERTVADALMGGSAKAALDVLPLVAAPLGLWGVPLLVGAQVGGRWVIEKIRDRDRRMQEAFETDLQTTSAALDRADAASVLAFGALEGAADLAARFEASLPNARSTSASCSSSALDERFERLMASVPS